MRIPAVACALACAATVTRASVIVRPMNISISDQSTVLYYDPWPVGMNYWPQSGKDVRDPSTTWYMTDSLVPWSESAPLGDAETGITAHITSMQGAKVTLSWVGTAIYYWGYFMEENTSVRLTIDGEFHRPPADRPSLASQPGLAAPEGSNATLFAAATGLAYGYHVAVLNLVSGYVALNNVTFTTGFDTEAKDSSMTDTVERPFFTSPAPYKYEMSSSFDTTGSWTPFGWFCNVSEPDCTHYLPRATTTGGTVSFDSVPNASSLQLHGFTTYNGGRYLVEISPSPPSGVSNFTSKSLAQRITRDSLMYHTPLDPAVQYRIVLADIPDDNGDATTRTGFTKVVYRLTTCTACTPDQINSDNEQTVDEPSNGDGNGQSNASNSPKSPNKTNVGAIAGGVVGGVVGALSIALLAFLLCRRQRRRRSKPQPVERAPTLAVLTALPPSPKMQHAGATRTFATLDADTDARQLSPIHHSPTWHRPSTSSSAFTEMTETTSATGSSDGLIISRPQLHIPGTSKLVYEGQDRSRPPRSPRQQQPQWEQERDLGRIAPITPIELIPPSYEASWISEPDALSPTLTTSDSTYMPAFSSGPTSPGAV